MIIVVDTDGLVGSLNPNDSHFATSQKILKHLSKLNATFLYPATVIVETVTLLQGRLAAPEIAAEIIDLVKQNKLQIVPIDDDILQLAGQMMNLKGTKHNTMFDCIVAVVAKKHQADAIFSFDKFYKKQGLALVSEL